MSEPLQVVPPRVVVVAVLAASGAVTLASFVVIAVMLGWIAPRGAPPPAAASTSRPAETARPEAGLLPGETVVKPADAQTAPAPTRPAPVTPVYARKPHEPRPAPGR